MGGFLQRCRKDCAGYDEWVDGPKYQAVVYQMIEGIGGRQGLLHLLSGSEKLPEFEEI